MMELQHHPREGGRPKTVVVTGAAGGLGRALVLEFLRKGHNVHALIHETSLEIRHPRLQQTAAELENPDEIREVFGMLAGQLDILVNNAGLTCDGPVWALKTSVWNKVFDVNLNGAFYCSREAARIMHHQGTGHIINVSSFAAKHGHRGQSHYAASKAGMIGMTQSMAMELAPRGIRVNAVLPGVMLTGMTRKLQPDAWIRLIQSNLLGKASDPSQVAGFIAYLAEMDHVSGQVFQLDSRLSKWT